MGAVLEKLVHGAFWEWDKFCWKLKVLRYGSKWWINWCWECNEMGFCDIIKLGGVIHLTVKI